ncbi:hypothetical protein [Pseudanabaena sp. PCC 6802]|uniref:hypothetical protein n=1 Tax=Pseudanabaena sp. PCC 6802 TaxID=118173 RepID=UPI0003451416|nr:hypothetical protein [Pseudanabaena sp. PCC 6802]
MRDRKGQSSEISGGDRKGTRSIFRDDAVRRYIESRERSVLPRMVSPQIFLYLWALLGLIATSGLCAWVAKIPIYASGQAIVTRWQSRASQTNQTNGIDKEAVVVIFLPPQYLSKLRPQQKLFLKFAGIDDRFSRTILTVESEIRSPDSIQKQFALSPGAAQAIAQPVAVAIAPWETAPTQLPANVYLGSLGHVEVEIGSQRAISLLPIVGQLFTEDALPQSLPQNFK